MAVRGAASRDGEGENSLPTPSADSDAHFSRSARGGGGSPDRHWEGAFRSVEGHDCAVAVRRRHGQAVRGTRRHPSRFADSQKTAHGERPPPKTAPHVWKHQVRSADV